MSLTFGIDFGTTNSLASVIDGDRTISLLDGDRPHPSVLWYRGSELIVGRAALDHIDLGDGGTVPVGFVRSPKMSLRREGPIYVEGREIEVTDAVAEVLRHIKRDAAKTRLGPAQGYDLAKAVMTIPVNFGGPERRALRESAKKAGIGVVQFVHEPVAALYAYLRTRAELKAELGRLEGRPVLVFDWGGGTLDLTLCRVQGGAIMQMASLGDNDVGGDRFDDLLKNFLRRKHAERYKIDDVSALEQPGMAARLLRQCETTKIRLSNEGTPSASALVKDFLRTDDASRHLAEQITRAELQELSKSLVARGLTRIDEILESARLDLRDIDLCLATGGMVNMPAIRDGLTERFLGRVPRVPNGDRIIAEGAAWIAHDGLRLTLSKPIEILVADSSGSGTYYPLVEAGLALPMENMVQNAANTRLFCSDPREGVAVVEIAKPASLGRPTPRTPRQTLCVANVLVDRTAAPLIERIECKLQIDHDYVATVSLRSTGAGDETTREFHDLDFGLQLPGGASGPAKADKGRCNFPRPLPSAIPGRSSLVQRTNIGIHEEGSEASQGFWRLVPGDLIERWRSSYFDVRGSEATARQKEEREFYTPCAICRRSLSRIRLEGRGADCKPSICGL